MSDSDALLKLVMKQIDDRRNRELIVFTIPQKYNIDAKTQVLKRIIDEFSDRADIVKLILSDRQGYYDYWDITNFSGNGNAKFWIPAK